MGIYNNVTFLTDDFETNALLWAKYNRDVLIDISGELSRLATNCGFSKPEEYYTINGIPLIEIMYKTESEGKL